VGAGDFGAFDPDARRRVTLSQEDVVTATLIPAAILFVVTIVGIMGFRRFSDPVRITFDAICFLAISTFFLWHESFPVFPPLQASAGSAALWLRAVGGAWWLLGSRLIVTGLSFIVHRNRHSREARMFSDLLAAAIYITTAAVVLNSVFALPVTGVVATSGILAIVLGLALQNTLADVFAGIAVGIEAPFGVDDRIEIGDRLEGQVVQVNWRSTRIQTDGDDIAIIPNSLIAKAEIINRSFPSQRRAASVELPCPVGATPERVIEVLLHATMLCPDILQAPAATAVLTELGSEQNVYRISFIVESTERLRSTKDTLLRAARRQLLYAGLLDKNTESDAIKVDAAGAAPTTRRLLGDLVLFEALAERWIDDLTKSLELHRLEPEEKLFTEGTSDASLYVVVFGVLEVSRQVGEVTETIGNIGAGEYIGEIGMLTGAPHVATAIARTHCLVYRLPREAIAPLLSENAELASAFDKSIRRGLEIVHRSVAARAAPSIGAKGQLLLRIRSFFRSRAA
jgi:small-conductance mechanosensitive channel/CRP-like cAMP-binding protein